MNLDTASKFELNKRLSELRGIYEYGHLGIVYSDDGSIFNPCYAWNDIMPIAVELGRVVFGYGYVEISFMDNGCDHAFEAIDESPQIALVKCCIKVLEASNG